MKIYYEEIEAALAAWWKPVTIDGRPGGEPAYVTDMRAALKAAYAARKARNAKKRAKAKPSILDEDQQEALRQAEQPENRFKVGDRVRFGERSGEIVECAPYGGRFLVKYGHGINQWMNAGNLMPGPAALSWNGKFEVGKAYRTRDGRKATVDESVGTALYPLRGRVDDTRVTWTGSGLRYCHAEGSADLIGPWED